MPRQRTYYQQFPLGTIDTQPAEQIPDQAIVASLNMELDNRSNLRTRPGVTRLSCNGNLIQTTANSGWSALGANITVTDDVIDGPLVADGLADRITNTDYRIISNAQSGSKTILVTDPVKHTASWYFRYDDTMSGHLVMFEVAGFEKMGFTWVTGSDRATGFFALPFEGSNPALFKEIRHVSADWYRVILEFDGTVFTTLNTFPMKYPDLGMLDGDGNTTIPASSITPQNTIIDVGGDIGFNTGLSASLDVWGAVVETGNFTDKPFNFEGLNNFDSADNTFTRWTSMYEFRDADGNSEVLGTAGNRLMRFSEVDQFWVEVSTFGPDDTNVQWITYDGEAYLAVRGDGVSDAELYAIPSVGAIPSLITDNVQSTALDPMPRYIELWNDRVWVVDDNEPNVVHCSELGNGREWTAAHAATGAGSFEIGNAENEPITGIKAHNDRLYVFKRDRIYYIDTESSQGEAGQLNVDLRYMSQRLWTAEIGCLSGYTIHAVLNDLVWLSASGIVLLQASLVAGGLERSIISRNVEDFRQVNLDVDRAVAVVDPIKSQYIISFPTRPSLVNNKCWVMDYTNEGQFAWLEWDSLMIASAYARRRKDGKYHILVGGYARQDDGDQSRVYQYLDDESRYNDDSRQYTKEVITKAFNNGDSMLKKRYHRYSCRVQLLSTAVDLTVEYRYDQDGARSSSTVFSLREGLGGGARFNVSLFSDPPAIETFFAFPRPENRELRYRIHGSRGRYGNSIQFTFFNGNIDEAFVLKEMSYYISATNERYTDED